ncbi:MAG: hypothetical protein QOI78_5967 [Actinomycetota bacterium]|nr:hypothetical protein [Actinomycetota bacterium]
MSVLAVPLVADTLARLFGAIPAAGVRPHLRFPEIPGRTREVRVPTRHGEVEATVYAPPSTPGGVYVNAHGGGFVAGRRAGDDPWCRFLAEHAGVTVVNVEYALAPRRRFPVPCEQLHDVLRWAAAEWPAVPLCVGGQSAGGSLAAAAARLSLRDGGPDLALQVLHYPPLDLVTAARDKPAGRSVVTSAWMGEIFDTAYVPDVRRRTDPLVSPAWGTNGDGIEGIAPAVVVTAELDRLRAEAVTYAGKLAAAGALVEHRDVAGVDHGYNLLGASAELTRELYGFLAGHVRRAVTGAP